MIYKVNEKLLRLGAKEDVVKDKINKLEIELSEILTSNIKSRKLKINEVLNNTITEITEITKGYAIAMNIEEYKEAVNALGKNYLYKLKQEAQA
jgi:hypothetical protein